MSTPPDFDIFIECHDIITVPGPTIVRLRLGGQVLADMVSGEVFRYGSTRHLCEPGCWHWDDPSDYCIANWDIDLSARFKSFVLGAENTRFVLGAGNTRFRISSTPAIVIEEMLICVATKAVKSESSPTHGLRWYGDCMVVSQRRTLDEICADVARLHPEVGARQVETDMRRRIAESASFNSSSHATTAAPMIRRQGCAV